MRTMKMIAIMICGIAVFAACNNTEQPAEKETVIIKEDSDKDEPIVIEEKDDDGIDFKVGRDEDGKVDMEVEGKVKND